MSVFRLGPIVFRLPLEPPFTGGLNVTIVPENLMFTAEQIDWLRETDSPTLANAIEKFDQRDRTVGFIGGHILCQFPEMRPMVGYALTVTMGNKPGPVAGRAGYWKMWEMLEEMPAPAVLVVKDVSGEPHRVAYAGEVMATLAKRLGAVGMVTDGAFRDVPEVRALGMHYFMQYPVVSHGNFEIIDVGMPIEMDGELIETGDMLHGDANGIVVIPRAVMEGLPDAVSAVRNTEKRTMDFIKSDRFTLADLKAQRGY